MIYALLVAAAFLAGALNAVAGGGTLLTFPVLVLAGLPPITASATNAVVVLPGYISSALGFRKDRGSVGGLPRGVLICAGLVGGGLGGSLLLVTPAHAFDIVVPVLLAIATIAFAAGPKLAALLQRVATPGPIAAIVGVFVVSAYGGYFNGGLGILLLATLSLLGLHELNALNGLKAVLSAAITLVSAIAFTLAGAVEWWAALLMMAASTAGGYAGARVARRLPRPALRVFIVAVGTVMTLIFAWHAIEQVIA